MFLSTVIIKLNTLKMIGQPSLTRDEMLTAVIEIEGVINSYPLSCLSMSDLTPSHLIVRQRLLNYPDNLDCLQDPDNRDIGVATSKLTRCMKDLASVLNQFWKRWRSEYLAELRKSYHYFVKRTALVRV